VRKGKRSERLKWTQKGERKEEINRDKGKDKHREKDGEREIKRKRKLYKNVSKLMTKMAINICCEKTLISKKIRTQLEVEIKRYKKQTKGNKKYFRERTC